MTYIINVVQHMSYLQSVSITYLNCPIYWDRSLSSNFHCKSLNTALVAQFFPAVDQGFDLLWCCFKLHCISKQERRLHSRCYFEQMQTWHSSSINMVCVSSELRIPNQLAVSIRKHLFEIMKHFWSLLDWKLRQGCEQSTCFCPTEWKWKTY